MFISRSSNLIKSWWIRGHHNKIKENMNQKAKWFHKIRGGERRDRLNMVESYSRFDVRRSEPELVRPSRPTHNEMKNLSTLDEQDEMRYHLPIIMFYRAKTEMKDRDPAEVIKKALGEALVYYYPWAGRLSDRPMKRLAVECIAEGVMFGEAEADISLDQLGEQPLLPPYPYLDQFLSPMPHPMQIVGCPLLTFQVTRLSCGGFILALRFNHVVSDGAGLLLFLTAIAELARGASSPSILPVWRRHLLNSGDPRCKITPNTPQEPPKDDDDLVRCTFIFNHVDVAKLRSCILRPCTTTSFELIAAALWRCRTIALQYEPTEEVCLGFAVNARPAFNPPLPTGYYGNATTLAAAVTPVSEIYDLSNVVEKVKKAKGVVIDEYERSLIGPGISRSCALLYDARAYLITDVSRLGFLNLDFGWGNPVYGGLANDTNMPHRMSVMSSFRNEKGEGVRFAPLYLPKDAMERFHKELDSLLKED